MSTLLVAGSVALDTLEGPFGRVEDELGGSAVYFALAASLVMPLQMVAPVGHDAIERLQRAAGDRPIDMAHVSVIDAPTYRWQARQVAAGRNLDLGSRDQIYDLWEPQLPDHGGWAFIGSMRTRLQLSIAQGLRSGSGLLAADSMGSYAMAAPAEATDLIGICDWFFSNDEELAGLGGDPEFPEAFRLDHNLKGLCVKSGAGGASVFTQGVQVWLPAVVETPVVDTTGAGDALAGGFLARWLQQGGRPDRLTDALAHGIACASLTIEEIGVRRIARATRQDLVARVDHVWRALEAST